MCKTYQVARAPTRSAARRRRRGWAGVPLARLLWQLPPAPAAALLEALLLERRVLLVSRDAGTVSTAVVACAAALHPFAWHHIFVLCCRPA